MKKSLFMMLLIALLIILPMIKVQDVSADPVYFNDVAETKKVAVSDRTLSDNRNSQVEDCGNVTVQKVNNSLICMGGAQVPDCTQTTDKPYGDPFCLPGTEEHNGSCWSCPGKK